MIRLLGLFFLVTVVCSPAFGQVANGGTSQSLFSRPSGKAFNPDIGANFLGLAKRQVRGSIDRNASDHNGLMLQEAELQLLSDVDPYFRASMLLSISQKDGSTDYGIDPEEIFAETISLPVVTLKGGKFKAALGKHNQLHTHAFPFIDAPLINTDLLGTEGLNEPAVSASVLLPMLPWFSELTLQATAANNSTLYQSPNSGDYAQVASFRNLWDLSDSSTIELALYGTRGANKYNSTSRVFGSDLIFKWRPTEGGKYHAFIWQTEYLNGNIAGGPTPLLSGLASWVQWQFAQRWWAQGRAELEGLSPRSTAVGMKRKQSALVGFFPSEFSGFRLQYSHMFLDSVGLHDHSVAFQVNFSIGAHPAHAY